MSEAVAKYQSRFGAGLFECELSHKLAEPAD
jgi:hypothetical protein